MRLSKTHKQIFDTVVKRIEAGLDDDYLDSMRSDPVSLVLINDAAYALGFSFDVIPPAVKKLTRPVDELLDEHGYIDLGHQDFIEELESKGACLYCHGTGKAHS